MLASAEFWVMIGLFIFIGVLLYLRVPGAIAAMLDRRIDLVRGEIEEAARLRSEAEKLLATHAARRAEAEREVEEILDVAREEAEALVSELRREFEESIARRRAAAEDSIRQAEYEAVRRIRARAAELSVATAEELLRARIRGRSATRLIDESVKTIGRDLH
ncbi:MAG TPA: ATP F0F1 synthase subunit B [Thermopetrobacter sp.]|nr:ATP F0F1 synthase subunit B [Thermopetrobacter sp.]